MSNVLEWSLVTVFTRSKQKMHKLHWTYVAKEKCYANMVKNSGATPGNVGEVLKYLLLENGVELPETDGTCVWRKEGYFC